MIKVPSRGTVEERLRLLEFSVNYSPLVLAFPVVATNVVTVPTTGVGVGAIVVDRSVFRKKLPDAKWIVWAAGLVDPTDANGLTLRIDYLTNANATVTLGSTTLTAAGVVKWSMGPFDVFGTGGVPAGEMIPVIQITGVKLVSGTASLFRSDLWLELRANKQ